MAAATEPKRSTRAPRDAHGVPLSIVEDSALMKALEVLPSNYNFEIPKTIWRLREARSKVVALQFPEGLLMFSCLIADILERFTGAEPLIMGDVTYGACCVDDFTAEALGADFLIHYGHSCLFPVKDCCIQVLYVFVEIQLDVQPFVNAVVKHVPKESRLAIVGTIQFISGVQLAARALKAFFPSVVVPQCKPLSRGEVLGCTAPELGECDVVVSLADGRFHLEAVMIQNPQVSQFYKYDPYNGAFTSEGFDNRRLLQERSRSVEQAKEARFFGVVLSALGRQGSRLILRRLRALLDAAKKEHIVVLLSEIMPAKLAAFDAVDAWIQIGCPRLSLDWGSAFDKPLLTPYEAMVLLEQTKWQDVYPTDNYRYSGGAWTNFFGTRSKQTGHTREELKAKMKARRQQRRRKQREHVDVQLDTASPPPAAQT